jgi:hypothetical protein
VPETGRAGEATWMSAVQHAIEGVALTPRPVQAGARGTATVYVRPGIGHGNTLVRGAVPPSKLEP